MGYQREAPSSGCSASGAVSFVCYGWAEIAVALETDQLSTMSHALPCAQSDEEEDE